jgi:flagellar assembly protein FliH
MSYLLLASAPSSVLLTDDPILRREDVAHLNEAAEIVARLEAHRHAAREAAIAEGFAKGQAEGAAKAARETAETLAGVHNALQVERARLRASSATLALDIVRRIAAGLAPDEVVAALAEQAVRDLLPEEPIDVRVAPEAVSAVSRRLWPIGARIEVRADPDLPDGDCVLDTPSGRTHAGLEVQLKALETVFASRNEAGA